MEWIEIEKQLPPYKKHVLITDEELNKEEGRFLSTVGVLKGVWTDEGGSKPEWEDIYNSGIIQPTHYCMIPDLKEVK